MEYKLSFMRKNCPFEEARYIVIPVPYDSSTSWLPGARFGPYEVIDASKYVEFYDIELGTSFEGIWTMEEVEPVRASPSKTLERVERAVSTVIIHGKFPILLGGDHSITVAGVKALKREYDELLCLSFDAHTDLHDEYDGSRYSHACAMRRCLELTGRALIFGVRSMSKEVAEFINEERGVRVITALEAKENPMKKLSDALDEFGDLPIYLSFDVDFLDPSIMPCTGTPEPGGFDWYTTTMLLRKVISSREVVGMDFVEFSPIVGRKDAAYLLAKLIYKSILYLNCFQTRREQ